MHSPARAMHTFVCASTCIRVHRYREPAPQSMPFLPFGPSLGVCWAYKIYFPVYKLTPTYGQICGDHLVTISNWLNVKDFNPD